MSKTNEQSEGKTSQQPIQQLDEDKIRQVVRDRYGAVARASSSASGCGTSSCCSASSPSSQTQSEQIGYSAEELRDLPLGANLGLGCGNPQAISALKPGETVVDLGSGAGIDCFLSAVRVGETGRVIGVDMTPDMVAKARENARQGGFTNVEFRLGEIEHLPVADATADVIISNCVVNLSPDKPAVYREAFRVLKPGGRVAIADVVATAQLPEEIRSDLRLYSECVAGAASIAEIESMLTEAGFRNVKVQAKDESRALIREWAPGRNLEDYLVSATIQAEKPEH